MAKNLLPYFSTNKIKAINFSTTTKKQADPMTGVVVAAIGIPFRSVTVLLTGLVMITTVMYGIANEITTPVQVTTDSSRDIVLPEFIRVVEFANLTLNLTAGLDYIHRNIDLIMRDLSQEQLSQLFNTVGIIARLIDNPDSIANIVGQAGEHNLFLLVEHLQNTVNQIDFSIFHRTMEWSDRLDLADTPQTDILHEVMEYHVWPNVRISGDLSQKILRKLATALNIDPGATQWFE